MRTEIFYGERNVTLKAYLWEGSEELAIVKRPAILVIPGGGYVMCSDREAEPIALAYMARGFQAFVLRYTVQSAFEHPMKDVQWAMEIIKGQAQKFHIHEDRIAVCGFSAGGHLACALGTMGKIKPNAMVLGYPAVLEDFWKKAGHYTVPDLIDKIDEMTPPTFIVACTDDPTVPIKNSIELVKALDASKVPFEMHIFHKGGHGFALADEVTAAGDSDMDTSRLACWVNLSVEWLKEVMGSLEVREKCKVLPENLSEQMERAFVRLMESEKIRKILAETNPIFENKILLQAVGNASLAEVVISIGMTEDEIRQLSVKLDEAKNGN